jgi:hypothetical protein
VDQYVLLRIALTGNIIPLKSNASVGGSRSVSPRSACVARPTIVFQEVEHDRTPALGHLPHFTLVPQMAGRHGSGKGPSRQGRTRQA